MKKLPVRSALLVIGGLFAFHIGYAHTTPPYRTVPADSVGVEKKDGKRFILHRVDEGQTLFAIARRYNRTVAEIKSVNPDMNVAVKYGQLVRVPIPDGALSKKQEKTIDKVIKKQEKEEKREAKAVDKQADKPVKADVKPAKSDVKAVKADDPARAGIHVVEPRQTLYSLATRYGVSQDDLRKWNNLPGNNVLIGQALIVSEKAYQARMPSSPTPAATPAKPAETPKPADTPNHHSDGNTTPTANPARPTEPRTPESRPAEPKPERRPDAPSTPANTKPAEPENRSSTKPADKPADVEIESPRPGNDAPMPTRGRRVSSSGVAEMIEGNDGSGKYLALHRSAAIGTLVQVRNEFNNQSLWVKVIGRLPNTGVNDKILIKLSTQAFAKLSPEDRRFRAEVSYIVR